MVILEKRAHKLIFELGFTEIFIHAIGPAIYKAIDLSLKLQNAHPLQLRTAPNTATVRLIDDYIPKQVF